MTNIKTFTAGVIAALGIAGAALLSAGTAAAATDLASQQNTTHTEVPTPGHLVPSPQFAPRHIDPALGFGQGDSPAFTHRHHHRHR